MYKYSIYAFYIKNIIMGIIFISLVSNFQYVSIKPFLVLAAFIMLMINDCLRYKYFNRDYSKYYISLLLSFCVGVWFLFTYTDFYFYALLFEILIFLNKKFLKIFLTGHIFIYLIRYIYSNNGIIPILSISYWRENGLDFLEGTLFYIMFIFIFLYIRVEFNERIRAQKINDELNKAYAKLEEYSSKVEELAITKERNRVASDIHDSLGHSITALIMHLDFLENVIDGDTQKAKSIISKCQRLARESMQGLRKAVYTLKEEEKSKGLKTSINELINNFTVNESIKIDLNLEDDLENISPNIKNIIYRTVQEALTNGIRHGKATEFLINIFDVKAGVKLKINNNGIGCEEIVMGNGLCNIKKRIDSVDGSVTFSSKVDKGFFIEAYIPLKEVELIL